MSKTTWLKEFYPVPADKISGGTAAIYHSLLKWRGLRRSALRAHRLKSPPIEIYTYTCALCHLYYDNNCCEACPLFAVLGKNCDDRRGPYRAYINRDNPEPMIRALYLALKETINE